MADGTFGVLQRFIGILPQANALEITLVEAEPGVVTLRMPYSKRLIGDPDSRVIHGGAVSTLLDTCAGGAVVSHPDINGAVTATLDLRIDYMRPATPDFAVFARAECYHVTRSVAFVRGSAWTEDRPDRAIAMATGAFTANGRKKPDTIPGIL